MAKVFRFHQGSDNIEDWQVSTAYGKNAIEAIQDPAGATARKEITSIPSPFARIDLVKTAFENVAGSNQIEGNTIFHKMVSDSLDVGEIFFNLDKLQDKVNIIVWDKTKDLQSLLQSDNYRHRLLGETLKLYLEQDAKAYNFNETQRLYLLNYKSGPSTMNIIGGTSPASLFFTSANKLNYVDIQFGNDLVFDDTYQPLYKRDFEYQKLLYGIKNFMPGFTKSFKAVDDYLDINFKFLSEPQKAIIRNYTKVEFEKEFEKLTAGSDNSFVEVLDFQLRKKTEQPANIQQGSGFVIASHKYSEDIKPLVLPIDEYSEKTIYTSDLWNRSNKVNYSDEKPLKERILPFDGGKYPYLTISDFLEPYLIRTVYPIHKEKYFDGNFSLNSGDITKGFLLPIKKEYFDFFDVKDLQGVTADGKKVLEIKQMSTGGVTVTLRIPILNNRYITYERIYYPPTNEYQITEPEISRNRGAIIENQFGLTVYPFLKLAEDNQNHYRVAFMDRDTLEHTKHNKYILHFYKNSNNKQVKEKAVKQRSEKSNDNITSDYYVLEEGFDYIEVKNSWANGLVIPKFKPLSQGTSSFNFAVDFGTTNTHIEYTKDNSDPLPFEINEEDIQIGTLHDLKNPETIKSLNKILLGKLLVDIIPQEIIPQEINKKGEFHFPLRTAINSNFNLDIDKETYALADFNIPFVYEKYSIPKNSKTRTNLKWSDYTRNPNEIKVIDAFFENLLLLIRNKVLLNGGDLNKTKLIWLYPSSMTLFRINMLESKWNLLFKKYINTIHTPEKLSESIAPFYYFSTQLGIHAMAHSVVSIDIGGGTTDVVVYKNNQPELLTSFRFAANSIFGDAFGRSSSINGFIQKYLERIKYLLDTNNQYDLSKVLEDVKEKGKSEDIVAFFFSIEKNRKIQEQNIPISFTKKLMLNSDFKIIFILFYASIIYHVAKLMKAKSIDLPRYITFSGTGSKIINIADSSDKLSTLTELTQIIFKKVFDKEDIGKIELKQDQNPKEISCKGALKATATNTSIDKIKAVLLGTTENILIPDVPKTYNDLDSETENSIITEYSSFIEWFFALNKEFSFKNHFGINPSHLELYKEFLKENAMDDLKFGIQEKKKELEGDLDINLEETLFFYPLIGGLNHLAYKIHSELNSL